MKYYLVHYVFSNGVTNCVRFARYQSVLDFLDNLYVQYEIESVSIVYE